jgi:uncharacterized protein YbaP (TraB family)
MTTGTRVASTGFGRASLPLAPLLLALILAASLFPAVLAAEEPGAGRPDADQAGHPNALLYEIRSETSTDPSYLFGTIHSEDPRVLDLAAPVLDAFRDSRGFALEVVPDADAIIRAMVSMTFKDGRTLSDALPPELYPRAAEALKGLGMPPAAFNDFKPWAVVTLLSVPRGENGEFLDLRLHREAVEAGKRVAGLETMEEQLAIFEGLDESDQVALLRETLDSLDSLPDLLATLIAAYLERDLDALQTYGDRYLDGADPRLAALFREVAVRSRNHRMAERMGPLLDEGGWFIAVGALHLPGTEGILALLRAQGYRVSPHY